MTGYPNGQDPLKVHVLALGLELPWTWAVLWRWQLIHGVWHESEVRRWDAARKKQKQPQS